VIFMLLLFHPCRDLRWLPYTSPCFFSPLRGCRKEARLECPRSSCFRHNRHNILADTAYPLALWLSLKHENTVQRTPVHPKCLTQRLIPWMVRTAIVRATRHCGSWTMRAQLYGILRASINRVTPGSVQSCSPIAAQV